MSRPRIYFYVARNRQETRIAVPVHLADGNGSSWALSNSSPWVGVRGLAGRWKGQTFIIVQNDLYPSIPSDAKLVPGGRAALKANAPYEPKEAEAARALRKKLGTLNTLDIDTWTERRANAAFAQVERLAESLYPHNPNDLAWKHYNEDRERWIRLSEYYGRNRPHPNRHPSQLIAMLDMILGAAERTKPPAPYSRGDVRTREKAISAERYANELAAEENGSYEARLELADAFAVAEDAWKEAGDEDRAERSARARQFIIERLTR